MKFQKAIWAMLLLAMGVGGGLCYGDDARKLGTIGPPPRKDPQRQTSGESVPPLPLPATPMRRSEPKAEPSPPLFIERLAYGKAQDYKPNPGDLDNLLRHVRAQMDAWYGYSEISTKQLIEMRKAGTPCQVPMLYMTGYDAFQFTDEERAAIREYLVEGGTLVADATLGSPAFTGSFRDEVHAMFPDRKLDVLQLDHPVMRGYYKYSNVNYFTINEGIATKMESPPQFLGMNLAARTAIIFSPFDMTCGWDDFLAPSAAERVPGAPRTMAMMPPDALRMGVNIVAYVSAERRFAKAQANTREVVGAQADKRAALTLALLRHNGDWDPDPNSLAQLVRIAAQQTSMPMSFDLKPVDPTPDDLKDTPIVLMMGMDDPRLSDTQVQVLRRHIQAGGFLFINNTSGFAKFDREARALVGRIFPEQKLAPLAADHEIFHSLSDVTGMKDASTGRDRAAQLEAVTLDGRAAIVYSPNDTLGMLKGIHDPYANAYDAASSRRLILDVLCYAMRH